MATTNNFAFRPNAEYDRHYYRRQYFEEQRQWNDAVKSSGEAGYPATPGERTIDRNGLGRKVVID